MPVNLQKSVTHMLQPLVRLLLRHGVTHAEFSDWTKNVFVNQAENNFKVNDKKPTVSRIAIVTGINRKEVKRIQELPSEPTPLPAKHNRAARVVTGWLQDERFHNKSGQTRPLEYGDPAKDFNLLVKEYSGDVPARAVLDELIRVGTVSKSDDGRVTLIRAAYVPHESKEDMLNIFGESTADLLETLDHNIASSADNSRLQLSVVYDNLSAESVKEFKALSKSKATNLLQELDRFLSSQDRDLTEQTSSKDRYRAGLGLYLIENEFLMDDKNDD